MNPLSSSFLKKNNKVYVAPPSPEKDRGKKFRESFRKVRHTNNNND
jgi:hypothetical protein